MRIRLLEIELGSGDVQRSTGFFQTVLGLRPALQQEGLTVFDAGLQGLDFNLSVHFPQGAVCISFITDDLAEIQKRLKAAGITYEGPSPAHLGMTAIHFKSPDDYLIKVAEATASSPAWLKV